MEAKWLCILQQSAGGKFVHLAGPFCEQNRGASGLDAGQQVLENLIITSLVFGQCSIQLVHFRFFHRGRHSKVGRTGNDGVSERSREGLLLCIHAMAYRPALHHDNRVVAILALWCGGEAGDVARFHLLKAHSGKMVALVRNDVPVVGDQIVHDLLSIQTLDNHNINHPVRAAAASANLPDALDGQI